MLEGFRNWLKRPYDDDMDAVDWALFVGFILTLIIMWRLVMRHVLQEDD